MTGNDIVERLRSEYTSGRKTIIVIDTETGFFERFDKKLDEQLLKSTFQLLPHIPNTTISYEDIENDCVTKVSETLKTSEISAILVDIVLIEEGLDKTGIKLAESLKKKFPSLPIFNITSRISHDSEFSLISESSTTCADGVFIKPYLTSKYFSGEKLLFYIQNACRRKACFLNDVKEITANSVPSGVLDRYGSNHLAPSVLLAIKSIGEAAFWNILDQLLPKSQGTIHEMTPGRSGAIVFKIYSKFEAIGGGSTSEKGWLLKLDKKISSLQNEVEKHKELLKSVNRKYFPQLVASEPVVHGNVAGIAIELEDNVETFLQKCNRFTSKQTEKFYSELENALNQLYGDNIRKRVHLWKEFYGISEIGRFRILAFLQENDGILRKKGSKRAVQRVSSIIQESPIDKKVKSLLEYSLEIDIRRIHGDLNGNNILVKSDGSPILIDFSNLKNSHVCADLCKTERDITMRAGYVDPEYYDWNIFEDAKAILTSYRRGQIFNFNDDIAVQGSIQKSIRMIYRNRYALKQISPNLKEQELASGLIHYMLLGLLHRDISIQKKVLAVLAIDQLLELF